MASYTPRLLLAAGLVLAALAYLPVRGASFVYEDDHYLDAPDASWALPGRGLTQALFDAIGPDAGRQHVVSVGLHLVNGALVSAVGSALVNPWAGAFGALVFLFHPLNSEAVAYLSGRGELLVTLFGLIAVWGVLGGRWRWGVTLAALIGAAVSKEVGLIAGLWVLVTLWTRRSPSRAVLPVLYVAAGLIVGATATTLLSWIEAAGRGGPEMNGLTFLALQNTAVWHLLALAVWPVGLSIDHDIVGLWVGLRWISAGLSVLLLALLVWAWRRFPLMAWAAGLLVASVLPRFLFPTNEFLHEYHVYPAMTGVCVLIGAGLARACAAPVMAADDEPLGVGA